MGNGKRVWNGAFTRGDVAGPGTSVDENIALFDGTDGSLIQDSGKAFSTDGAFASNVDTKVPTEKAVKTYVDASVSVTPEAITSVNAGIAASILLVGTDITTNGDSDLDNVTLADGTVVGQKKEFAVVAVGNAADSVKITPATMVGGTQITFAANPLGLGCIMKWSAAGWTVISNNGGTIA